MDVGNCDRAGEIFAKKMDEFASKKGLQRTTKHPNVYFDKSRMYCVGSHEVTPESVFNDKQDTLNSFFEGERYFLTREPNRPILGYDNKILTKVREIFAELGFPSFKYYFLSESKILILDYYGPWGAIAPLSVASASYNFDIERRNFIDRTIMGTEFFNIESIKDDLVVLRPSELRIDWTKIDDGRFVQLCRDILRSLQKVKKVTITGGQGDFGQDIELVEDITDLTGEREQRWAIQCKNFQSRDVNPSDLAISSFKAFLKFNYDVYCVMTSGLISPGCHQFLESIENNPRWRVKVKKFDKKDLEDLIRAKPEMYVTYFT